MVNTIQTSIIEGTNGYSLVFIMKEQKMTFYIANPDKALTAISTDAGLTFLANQVDGVVFGLDSYTK